jgi:hypothetical protein
MIIGYGNTLRGDDGVGPAVAALIAARQPGIRAMALPMLVPELAPLVAAAPVVVFVDAGVDAPPGEVRVERLDEGGDLGAFGHLVSPSCDRRSRATSLRGQPGGVPGERGRGVFRRRRGAVARCRGRGASRGRRCDGTPRSPVEPRAASREALPCHCRWRTILAPCHTRTVHADGPRTRTSRRCPITSSPRFSTASSTPGTVARSETSRAVGEARAQPLELGDALVDPRRPAAPERRVRMGADTVRDSDDGHIERRSLFAGQARRYPSVSAARTRSGRRPSCDSGRSMSGRPGSASAARSNSASA